MKFVDNFVTFFDGQKENDKKKHPSKVFNRCWNRVDLKINFHANNDLTNCHFKLVHLITFKVNVLLKKSTLHGGRLALKTDLVELRLDEEVDEEEDDEKCSR